MAKSTGVQPSPRWRQAWRGSRPRMSMSPVQPAFSTRWATSMGNSLTGLTSA